MELVIIWVGLSALAGWIAARKGRTGIGFFFLALLLTPLIGLIAALVVERNEAALASRAIASGKFKRCPECAELVQAQATLCRYCRHSFVPVLASAVPQASERPPSVVQAAAASPARPRR